MNQKFRRFGAELGVYSLQAVSLHGVEGSPEQVAFVFTILL